MSRVVAALEATGFKPVQHFESYASYLRFDTANGVCILILDGGVPDVGEDQLIGNLDRNGMNLAEFWNQYEKIG
jgi:hypothetical protein